MLKSERISRAFLSRLAAPKGCNRRIIEFSGGRQLSFKKKIIAIGPLYDKLRPLFRRGALFVRTWMALFVLRIPVESALRAACHRFAYLHLPYESIICHLLHLKFAILAKGAFGKWMDKNLEKRTTTNLADSPLNRKRNRQKSTCLLTHSALRAASSHLH